LVSKDASEKEEGLVSVMASLNVRNKPSVSSNVIGYLYSNCVVSIYDTVDNSEGSWYLIKSGDVEGYVSSDYVLTGAAAKASDEDLTNRYAKVKANTAVVYSSASSSADSVGSVYKDGDYKVLAIQNGFVKIAVNEEFAGFVKAEDVSLYTRHAEAVAITDQMVKNQLDSYLVDIRDAEAIFEKRMAAADYQAAYNASTYAYQLWEYYINDASNAGYTDLVTTAKSEQKKTADMVARATAALNGETVAETSTEVPTTTTTTVAATSAEETTTSSQAQTSSSEAEETQPDQTEPTAPTTVEDTTTTTAEQTTPTTVEDTTTTTAEQTTPTTVEDTTTTTAEQTTPTTVEDTTTTTADNTTPSETVKAIQGIEAFYTGSSKTEGQVLSASELYIVVTYTDGTTQTVTEGLSCEQVGMMLSAGWNTVTVSYQGFSSSFDLNVATVEAPSETQPSDVPSSETVPDETTTTVEETAPSSEVETTTTVEETVPSSETETTTTTAAETTTTTVEATTTTTAAETTTTQEITTPSNNSTPLRDSIVNYALGWVGQCNYVYGGTDLSIGGSVDCSGFTMQVYSRVAGVSLPHHSMSQMNCGSAITYDQLRPGDLVFYNNPNHVAIYIGNGAIVHAGSPETGINVTSVFFKTPIGYRTYLP
jgi:cell wall-associated NlpC family hydrolase